MHQVNPHTRSRHQGYVLVVTLGLLMLASALLVAVGRMAMQHAVAAHLAVEDSQRRWGAASCQKAILPFAEQILAINEAKQKSPLPAYRVAVPLGSQTFELIISDEQAKANVNALLDEVDESTATARIGASLSGSGLGNKLHIHVAIDPDEPAATTQPGSPALPQYVSGFGQIFDGVPPDRLLEGLAPAAQRITCWGNGAINIMRASPEALELATGSSLGQVEIADLIQARNEVFDPSEAKHLAPLNSTPQSGGANMDPVARMFAGSGVNLNNKSTSSMTVTSACHSMWIIVHDSRRAWYELDVLDESSKANPRTDSYQW